jgi:PAS domain S-box-containing protein
MSNDYQQFLDSLELLLFVLDIDGTIINCNNTACVRLGYTRGELIGMPVVNIHPSEKRMFAAMLVDDIIKGNADFCPIPLQCKDGSLIQVETRVSKS